MRAPTTETLRQFADSWLEGAEAGTILSRRRTAYAPSTLRGYRHDFETYLYPDFGALRLSDFTRYEAQAVVDGLVAQGWSGSKVHNVLTPLQALYRYAKKRGKVVIDPTDDLELPAVESGESGPAHPRQRPLSWQPCPSTCVRSMGRRSTPAYGGASCKPSGLETFNRTASACCAPGMPRRGRSCRSPRPD